MPENRTPRRQIMVTPEMVDELLQASARAWSESRNDDACGWAKYAWIIADQLDTHPSDR